MATKYEVLASLVKRDHEAWAWQNQDEGDGNHHVIMHVLRILHEYETGPRIGGPNNPIDWEQAVDDIYEQIAACFNVEPFDEKPNEPSNRDVLTAIEDTIAVARSAGSDMPPELDIPDQH